MTSFRISDTFAASLAHLTSEEQKACKTTAFDLQLNLANPGNRFHKLDKARDKNFWSVRVSGDIRIIVHRTAGSLLLCYVDHHDKAYDWAERRKLETHPTTGAAQLVEIRERVEEIFVPRYVEFIQASPSQPKPLAGTPDEKLLSFGVPVEWLADIHNATEDELLILAERLPREAAEALLDLATGTTPRRSETVPVAVADPFEHPDAQRRFRVMHNVEELERALDFLWDKWSVFLHPDQRESVERNYNGPARISGSAGTGKTIVAVHRAVHLARKHPDARVLLTTFSEPLANALRTKVRRLIGNEPRLGERIDVHSLDTIAARLHDINLGKTAVATSEIVGQVLADAAGAVESPFRPSFVREEWDDVVDAWQLDTWESYRDVQRLGRKTRLPEARRKVLWQVFESVRQELRRKGLVTRAAMLSRLTAYLTTLPRPPYHFIVVDEAQDINVPQLRLLAALGGDRPNALFFTGDLGQRIFQLPFSWRALGVDIRGRSRNLRVNYRTSHQIRSQADRLLDSEVRDVDGNVEERRAIAVFNGPPPSIRVEPNAAAEIAAVSEWIRDRISEGVAADEIAVVVRSSDQLPRAREAVTGSGIPFRVLDERVETVGGQASICTMHLAKGLEFRAVVVMACDDGVVPLEERLSSVNDDSDLEEVYETERHLLYVACTRARDHLLVTGVNPASEFLSDLL